MGDSIFLKNLVVKYRKKFFCFFYDDKNRLSKYVLFIKGFKFFILLNLKFISFL